MCNVRLKFKGLSQILGSDNLVLAVLVDVACLLYTSDAADE